MIKSGFHFKQRTFTIGCQTQQLIHWFIYIFFLEINAYQTLTLNNHLSDM